MQNFNKNYWNDRYLRKDTAWDTKNVSLPLKTYIDQLKDTGIEILVHGCGNGYEVEYLFRKGFGNVYALDIVEEPLMNIKARCPEFPQAQLLNSDFFSLKGQFDLIIEQTFFCALPKELRESYVKKIHELLKPGGKLVGVLFDDPLNIDKPPFGGSKNEYISYFCELFDIKIFERCYNSIPPRAGRELFINLIRK